ncbi:MAG: DUF418 domain-containing protein [Actinomycetia bacterium]|nr:DUF418 domain-containing protein [Actinomycetes bacterium]
MAGQQRAVAPDLARGVMLLLIVLANIPWFLWGRDHGVTLGHPIGATGLDALVQSLMIVFVDSRALPMFALLFGYGMVQFAHAQDRRGTSLRAVKGMLLRRHVALVVLGALHAAVLFYADVLGTYGFLGLILAPLLFHRTTRTLKIVRGILVGLLTLFAGFMALMGWLTQAFPEEAGNVVIPAPANVSDIDSWAGSILPRLSEWGFITVFSIVALAVPIAILTGWIWAREGVLDRPQDHLPRLRRTALIGLPVAWLGGIPMMLTHTGIVWAPELSWAFMGVQMLTGLAGGLGYAACFGLLAARLTRTDTAAASTASPVIRALTAVGRRSLSAYLWQALIMAPLLTAWGLGLGGTMGSAIAAGIAILIWLASVAWCLALDKAGRRGPAEVLLRRVTYLEQSSEREPARSQR